MKRTHIILIAIGVILTLGLVWFFAIKTDDVDSRNQSLVVLSNEVPSIQILSGEVYIVSGGGNRTGELLDGDAIEAPLRIEVSDDGDATVLYPDGSSARLSPGAEVKIEEGSYNAENESVVSKIFVYSGHVWSKVVSLSTLDSSWEVETPHAVATVRGTAFDVGVENGNTEFVGSENSVDIVPIDPDTGEKLLEKLVSLIPEKKVVLDDDTNREIKNNIRELVLLSFDKNDSKNREWFQQNEDRDKIIEEIKNEIVNRVQEEEVEDRKQLLRDLIIEKREEIKEANRIFEQTQQRNEEGILPDRSIGEDQQKPAETTVVETKPSVNQQTTDSGSGGSTSQNPAVKSVSIRINIPGVLVEGTAVPFKVVAMFSDGKELDVTLEAKNKVLGGIGIIKEPGVFVAEIEPEKKELGQVFGAIVGEWVHKDSGVTIPFTTDPFSVKLKIETNTDLRG